MARSRYIRNKILDGNHYETFTLTQSNHIKAPDTFEGVEVIEYIVKRGERLDHLAARFLNDEGYWYVIALINNMTLPFPTANQKILIPVDVSEVLDRL